MSVRQFLVSGIFLKHLIISIVLTFAIIWGIFIALNLYTRHGISYVVPDLKGMTMDEIKNGKYEGNLEFIIIDSIFDSKKLKGSVVEQDPAPGIKVKYGRKIYLTTIAILPEKVGMPDLVDLSLRQANAMLETYGLRLGKLEYVPDIAENAVLQQKYKGEKIEPGVVIEKGSRIDLVLGKGLNSGNGEDVIPNLLAKFRDEALSLIGAASMNVGSEIYLDGKDTINARVYKQSPKPGEHGSFGQHIDLWYRSNKKFDFSTLKIDTAN